MAFINLLHNGYQGKLGETVGQKWKNQRTVRTYNPHNNSKSEAQLKQRENYKFYIDYASLLYPSAFNIKPPRKMRMNNFNFFTSLIKTTFEESPIPGEFFLFNQYNKSTITLPYLVRYKNEDYFYIYLPYEGYRPNIKDFSAAAFFIGRDTPLTPINKENIFEGTIIDKSIVTSPAGGHPRKGFLLKTLPITGPDMLYLCSIQYKPKKESGWSFFFYTQPERAIDDIDLAPNN